MSRDHKQNIYHLSKNDIQNLQLHFRNFQYTDTEGLLGNLINQTITFDNGSDLFSFHFVIKPINGIEYELNKQKIRFYFKDLNSIEGNSIFMSIESLKRRLLFFNKLVNDLTFYLDDTKEIHYFYILKKIFSTDKITGVDLKNIQNSINKDLYIKNNNIEKEENLIKSIKESYSNFMERGFQEELNNLFKNRVNQIRETYYQI